VERPVAVALRAAHRVPTADHLERVAHLTKASLRLRAAVDKAARAVAIQVLPAAVPEVEVPVLPVVVLALQVDCLRQEQAAQVAQVVVKVVRVVHGVAQQDLQVAATAVPRAVVAP
jgi:hypothetical protein